MRLLGRYGLQMELCWLHSGHSHVMKRYEALRAAWQPMSGWFICFLFGGVERGELNEDKKQNLWRSTVPGITMKWAWMELELGVIIDCGLWTVGNHILNIPKEQKLSEFIAGWLNNKHLHILYCSLIIPYMTHCAEVCGNVYEKNKQIIDPTITLPKRAIRIINKAYCKSINQMVYWVLHLRIIRRCVFRTNGNNSVGWE